MIKQGGTQANYTGTILEQFILARLNEQGYTYIDRNRFVPTRFLEQPIFTQKFHIGSSIYNTPQYCDFIVYHPKKWPNNLVIESKWQEVAPIGIPHGGLPGAGSITGR